MMRSKHVKKSKSEIVEGVIKQHGVFITKDTIRRVIGIMENPAPALSANKGLVTIKIHGKYYWGLAEWMDEDQNARPEFLPAFLN